MKPRKWTDTLSDTYSRRQTANFLGVGERQLYRYLQLLSRYHPDFYRFANELPLSGSKRVEKVKKSDLIELRYLSNSIKKYGFLATEIDYAILYLGEEKNED
jgi:hypothetical protein